MPAKRLIVGLLIGAAILAGAALCLAQDRVQRIHNKAQLVEQKAKHWLIEGKNPAQAFALMKQARQAFDSGNADLGEHLVDQALHVFDSRQKASAADDGGPISNLYGDPQSIEITGYDQDAMEPFISPDGKYLFFNNSNERTDTHVFCAKRLSDTKFHCLGPVPGTHLVNHPARGDERELVPSIDLSNRLYYSSSYSYSRDLKTLYAGHWTEAGVTHVEAVPGDISPSSRGWLNMDAAVSPDGRTLIISRARFAKSAAPEQSYLLIARHRSDGLFEIDPHSDEILKQVASPSLQYAPAITADGLELYFTRCQNLTVPTADMAAAPMMQTMVARRSSTTEPFGEPARLAAIDGFSEAPSVTLDKRELFFHRKDGHRFHIYRLQRKGN